MSSAGALVLVAVGLAVLDAACFGIAAVLQHRAVRAAVGKPTLDLRSDAHLHQHRLGLGELARLIRRPLWWAGTGLVVLGATLHIVALVLAPVSLIQPVGVLGVPIAVLLSAGLARYRPAPIATLPITVCVVGIGFFVWLAAGQRDSATATLDRLLVADLVVMAVIAAALLATRRMTGWLRCVARAVAGAVGLGMVSALVRGLAQYLAPGWDRLACPTGLAMLAGIVVAGVIGGWLVQQAYTSGPPEVVIACLTVVDPMVAVIVGFTLLGEGSSLGTGIRVGMVACGLAAAAGVVALAHHHPEAVHRRAERDRADDPPDPSAPAGRSEAQPVDDTPLITPAPAPTTYRWSRAPSEARSRG